VEVDAGEQMGWRSGSSDAKQTCFTWA